MIIEDMIDERYGQVLAEVRMRDRVRAGFRVVGYRLHGEGQGQGQSEGHEVWVQYE